MLKEKTELALLDTAAVIELLNDGKLIQVGHDSAGICVVSLDKGTTFGIVDYDTYIQLQDDHALKPFASNWYASHFMGADYYEKYTNHGQYDGLPPICTMK